MSVISDARFAARAASFSAYTIGMLAHFELKAWRMTPEAENQEILDTMRRYGRHMCKLFGIEVTREGFGDKGYLASTDASGRGRVFVMNHRSGLDIAVSLAHMEGRLVSRADLARWPLIGTVARRAGILFVNRENRRSAAQVVHQMIEAVEQGRGIIIFPEGTTFEGDELRPFKPGAFAVSRRTSCEIVPVGIAYAGAATSFGDESFAEHMRRAAGEPKTRVGLVTGEPIRSEDKDPVALTAEVHAAVQALIHRARELVG